MFLVVLWFSWVAVCLFLLLAPCLLFEVVCYCLLLIIACLMFVGWWLFLPVVGGYVNTCCCLLVRVCSLLVAVGCWLVDVSWLSFVVRWCCCWLFVTPNCLLFGDVGCLIARCCSLVVLFAVGVWLLSVSSWLLSV